MVFCLSLLPAQQYVIVIHGGAGDGITPENINTEVRLRYSSKMTEALMAGQKVLENGGSAVDAVETVIMVLEDSPLFNAGVGAVLSWDGKPELDASIMDGSTLKAGSISGVSRIKNPISTARRVMDTSIHVMLSREGAEEFAKSQNMEMVEPGYFKTDDRQRSLERYKKKVGYLPQADHDFSKHGTVGCVILDGKGHIAAGTSTGGMTGKRYGRVGDSPILGAGTYASNETCGISSTGHGEFFIRYVVAYDIHARMKYAGQSLTTAAESLIQKDLPAVGGKGGVIGIDKDGNIVMEFNTRGMFRAYVKEGEEPAVLMFE